MVLFDNDPISVSMYDAALEAGRLIRDYYYSTEILEVKNKLSHQDLVTRADTESQDIIVESISRSLGDKGYKDESIGFIGEENLDKNGEYIFVIDPIDGTTNFTSKINNFAVSIGCFVHGEARYGVTHDPINDCTYIAKKGAGAYKITQGKVTRLTMNPYEMDKCLLATYIHTNPEQREKEIKYLTKIYPFIKGVRIMGSGSQDLVRLADNSVQVVMFAKSSLWDIAAAYVVLMESGGGVFNLDGSNLLLDLDDPHKNYPLIACIKENISSFAKYIDP
ncbi:MAG: inositol monophosphatase [Microgenomates group bacterium]